LRVDVVDVVGVGVHVGSCVDCVVVTVIAIVVIPVVLLFW